MASAPPSPPSPPAACLRGAGEPCERLRAGAPCKAKHALLVAVVLLDGARVEVECDGRAATVDDVLQALGPRAAPGRPLALAMALCGELVFPPPALRVARLARMARAPPPAPPAAPPPPPALALTLLLRLWLLLPALPALSDAVGRRLLFLELRRRAAEGRLRGSRAQLRALGQLARAADAHAPLRPAALRPAPLPEEQATEAEEEQAAEARRTQGAFVAAAARLPLAGAHALDAVWPRGGGGTGPLGVALAVAADALRVLLPGGGGAARELLRVPWGCVRRLRHGARSFRATAMLHAPHASNAAPAPRARRLKFYLPHCKSMFLFHLASIHHQMYLKLQNQLTAILPSLELDDINNTQESSENRSNQNRKRYLYDEYSCKENNMFHKIASCTPGQALDVASKEIESFGAESSLPREAFVLRSSGTSSDEKFQVLHETLTESLLEKFEEMSFVHERFLCTVRIERDIGGSLGLQVECGGDGGIYIRCSLQHSKKIQRGDRIMAVDGQSLMHLQYMEALSVLKSAGHDVELILSRQGSMNTDSPTPAALNAACSNLQQTSPLRELQQCVPHKRLSQSDEVHVEDKTT